ncbi:hypothetical protein LOAG_14758 [Loa loa]|uniref:Uncharacterized protein n=1 Tax=Loa loa TaxID=7209 RepID=A0A1S0THN2_LOALO|nr:hypothetical protein LOAG_14758 [Loa loa]EFO13768.2 hypothetical protein LOAG_14758 [Loa loa]
MLKRSKAGKAYNNKSLHVLKTELSVNEKNETRGPGRNESLMLRQKNCIPTMLLKNKTPHGKL